MEEPSLGACGVNVWSPFLLPQNLESEEFAGADHYFEGSVLFSAERCEYFSMFFFSHPEGVSIAYNAFEFINEANLLAIIKGAYTEKIKK